VKASGGTTALPATLASSDFAVRPSMNLSIALRPPARTKTPRTAPMGSPTDAATMMRMSSTLTSMGGG